MFCVVGDVRWRIFCLIPGRGLYLCVKTMLSRVGVDVTLLPTVLRGWQPVRPVHGWRLSRPVQGWCSLWVNMINLLCGGAQACLLANLAVCLYFS